MTYTECPNCNAKIKDSLMFGNVILSQAKTELVNTYSGQPKPVYCQKCGNGFLEAARSELEKEVHKLSDIIKTNINNLPVISTHSPLNWDYDIVGMVTAQSVGGTGIFSEVSSSIDDFFGAQSGALTNKLKGGENICFGLLRKRALDQGGNAVIATDIDYSELGVVKGMIMVCMAGTAIKLKNIKVLGDEKVRSLDIMTEANNRFRKLNDLKNSA